MSPISSVWGDGAPAGGARASPRRARRTPASGRRRRPRLRRGARPRAPQRRSRSRRRRSWSPRPPAMPRRSPPIRPTTACSNQITDCGCKNGVRFQFCAQYCCRHADRADHDGRRAAAAARFSRRGGALRPRHRVRVGAHLRACPLPRPDRNDRSPGRDRSAGRRAARAGRRAARRRGGGEGDARAVGRPGGVRARPRRSARERLRHPGRRRLCRVRRLALARAAARQRHLLPAADALRRRLAGQGREAWVAEEMAARYGPGATLVQNPDTAWRRVAGRGKLRGEGLAALRAAAAWREREARRRDLPAAWLIKDATLVELARRRPRTPAEAERVRGLQIKRGRQLEELLQAIASPGPPPEAEAELPADVRRRVRVVLPLASAVLQARCAAAGVASELVATRADLEGLIANQALESDRAHPLLHGWRRELAGESLLRLLRGEISLRVLPGPPHVIE